MATVEATGVHTPEQEIVDVPPSIKPEPEGPCEVTPNPLIDDLNPDKLRRGVLIPLKTTQEVRQDHVIVQAWITRAPTKQANDVIKFVFLNPAELQPSCHELTLTPNTSPVLCVTCALMLVLIPYLTFADAPSLLIFLPT